MNRIKLLAIVAIFGISLFFSSPAHARYATVECYAGEVYMTYHYTLFGVELWSGSEHGTGVSC